MQEKISSSESKKIVESILDSLKKAVKKKEIMIRYLELALKEPHYQKLNCAYLQTANEQEGILYEPITRRYFYMKAQLVNKVKNEFSTSLSELSGTVGSQFPKAIKDKMFWVCGNKKSQKLELGDFGSQFTLIKPAE